MWLGSDVSVSRHPRATHSRRSNIRGKEKKNTDKQGDNNKRHENINPPHMCSFIVATTSSILAPVTSSTRSPAFQK